MSANDSDVQILQIIDEFIVDVDKVDLIKRYQSKIERMYNVHVGVENITVEQGTKQWIMIEGECGDRKDAKEFILAICSPNESHQIEFPPLIGLFTDENLEEIEKQTNAFIVPIDEKQSNFTVCGSDLAVTLALSMMEEMFNKREDDVEEDGQVDNKSGHPGLSPEGPSSKASERLSMKLERALSEHSDGTINVNDYSHAPESIKRVLVQCLHENFVEDDIDEDQLFADGKEKEFVLQKPRSGHISIFHDNKLPSMEAKVIEKMEIDRPAVGSISEKLTNTIISNPPPSPLFRKQHEYLRNFGVSVGYKQTEIDDALKFVDEKTRPSDFLDLLNKIKEKTDTEMELSPSVSVEKLDNSDEKSLTFNQNIPPPPSPVNSPFKRDLPGNYKERLIRDFQQEDLNCSREELIRRNAERQKLLQLNFQQIQQQQNKQEKSKKKGKTKKRKESTFGEKRTRKDSVEQPFHQENKQEGKGNFPVYGNQSDKEANGIACDVIDLCSSYEDNGKEETCLMEAWRPDTRFVPQKCGFAAIKDNDLKFFQPTQQISGGQSSNNFPPPYQASQTQMWGKGPRDASPTRGAYSAPVAKQRKYQPKTEDELRYIVIDGSNVAMTHGNGKVFSCKGIEICVNYFQKRGHKVMAFVPRWRTYRPTSENPIKDQEVLQKLKEDGSLVYTPSRRIGKRLIASYDDRFVLELAEHEDGIIVSNDLYRDLMFEKASWKKIIEERLLLYSFAGDLFMPPADPLGRSGPSLDEFLKKPRQTKIPLNYMNMGGNQHSPRKYNMPPPGYQNIPPPGFNPVDGTFHYGENFPQGGTNSVQQNFSAAKCQMNHINWGNVQKVQGQKQYNQRSYDTTDGPVKGKNSRPRYHSASSSQSSRSQEITEKLFRELKQIFPEPAQEQTIKSVLSNHSDESDPSKLAAYCTSVLFE
ncbi:hypothetical protein CHS0354_038542 [Potamilus streckersoni]|uniref:RNase NYN domain-containing protein n=1 Tax=Potamilus streckersoni TaxID=2493646 RepID=A0AAE0RRR0_9BIVA|nr:hypothetical protein CHS0354_038542 [Potamilus streckersoni]